jgi:stage II sporulation protein AA (anti-sigma F factor antagonist)
MVLRIKFKSVGTTLIVFMEGEIDHHWADYLKNKVDGEIIKSKNKNVIFDFGEVSFMDSSGIGVLIGRFKNIRSLRGKLVATNVKGQLERLFAMAGLRKIVPVYDTVDMALTQIQGGAV